VAAVVKRTTQFQFTDCFFQLNLPTCRPPAAFGASLFGGRFCGPKKGEMGKILLATFLFELLNERIGAPG